MANHEWSLDELRSKAEAYCARAEHCCAEVQTKLQQWGATEAQQQIILDDLQQNHYIDHARYCQAFAHDKLLYQGWGKMKIRAALYARRLPDNDVEKALDSIDEIEYNRILTRLISSKQRQLKHDALAREKLIRFCLQRGFVYEEIKDFL